MMVKTYTELITLPTFESRYEYLRLSGEVGEITFGGRRWLNQILYHSSIWSRLKDQIILRDNGRDLAMEGYEIIGPIIIHHINPISYEDVVNRSPNVFDPENLIVTKLSTHNAIHYGDKSLLPLEPVKREFGDTCPWRLRT